MPSWPSTLPEPVAGSLNVAPRDNILSYSGDIGAPTTRRRFTSRLIDYSARLYLSEAMRAELVDEFHHNQCADGSVSFTMSDWIGSGTITCKWTNPPQVSQAGPSGRWYVDVSFVKIE